MAFDSFLGKLTDSGSVACAAFIIAVFSFFVMMALLCLFSCVLNPLRKRLRPRRPHKRNVLTVVNQPTISLEQLEGIRNMHNPPSYESNAFRSNQIEGFSNMPNPPSYENSVFEYEIGEGRLCRICREGRVCRPREEGSGVCAPLRESDIEQGVTKPATCYAKL